MGETADKHDDPSSQCFSKISLLCVAVFLVSSLIWVCLGFSPFLLTISVLCLSSIFLLTVSNKKFKNPPEKNEVEQKVNQAVTLLSNAAQETEVRDFQDYQVESTDCPTASESSSGDDFSASEDFELNWTCFDNLGKNVAVSEILVFSSDDGEDDDDDEDDNLIEINFPDSSSAELNEESEEKLQIVLAFNDESEAKMQTELPESMFRQEGGIMELLEEINEVTEEENLIEIDLSMGSIKGQNH